MLVCLCTATIHLAPTDRFAMLAPFVQDRLQHLCSMGMVRCHAITHHTHTLDAQDPAAVDDQALHALASINPPDAANALDQLIQAGNPATINVSAFLLDHIQHMQHLPYPQEVGLKH